MKTCTSYLTRLVRVAKTGAGLGVALLAASALQAQPGLPAAPPSFPANLPHGAKVFLEEASQANQSEIAMANVAWGKSQSSQVKEFAGMLRTAHQNNLAQLQAIALAHGVTLDASLDMLNQHEVNRLQKANDADFDREYTKVMLKDHVKCIRRFERAAADIEEADIKQYAQNTLPALRRHLKQSEVAARASGVEESTISSILKGLPPEDRGVTIR